MPAFPEDARTCLEWFGLGLQSAGEVPTWETLWDVLTSRRRFEALLILLDGEWVQGGDSRPPALLGPGSEHGSGGDCVAEDDAPGTSPVAGPHPEGRGGPDAIVRVYHGTTMSRAAVWC